VEARLATADNAKSVLVLPAGSEIKILRRTRRLGLRRIAERPARLDPGIERRARADVERGKL